MNVTTTVHKDWENSTALVIYSSNSGLTAGAITGVVMAALVITVLLCKYKPSYFACFRQTMRDERRPSNVGLTHIDDEETDNMTNILESDIQVEDDYFYDEVFERSAFTDEMTNNSITNLFTITDLDVDDQHHSTLHNHESHI